uniref:Uncharacterized protein n=1 Tax=Arundo donax TaxID=35708 RepID=A0A0A9H7X5_ARUDO
MQESCRSRTKVLVLIPAFNCELKCRAT